MSQKKVYANGSVQVGFFYLNGKNDLEIEQVQLLENGKVIATDDHHALADQFRGTSKIKPFFYNFSIEAYKPTAIYTINAMVRGLGVSIQKVMSPSI